MLRLTRGLSVRTAFCSTFCLGKLRVDACKSVPFLGNPKATLRARSMSGPPKTKGAIPDGSPDLGSGGSKDGPITLCWSKGASRRAGAIPIGSSTGSNSPGYMYTMEGSLGHWLRHCRCRRCRICILVRASARDKDVRYPPARRSPAQPTDFPVAAVSAHVPSARPPASPPAHLSARSPACPLARRPVRPFARPPARSLACSPALPFARPPARSSARSRARPSACLPARSSARSTARPLGRPHSRPSAQPRC